MRPPVLGRSARSSRVFRLTKSGTLQLNPTDLENAAASALAGAADGATFVTLATDNGLDHLFITDDAPGQEGVAFSVARAMAAQSEETDELPDLLQVPGFARLVFRQGTTPMQDTQSGADFTALSRIIGDMLMPGEWLAVSTRKAKQRTEVRAQARWLDFHGMRTHHSRKSGAAVAQFYAGARSNARAKELLLRAASAIPGFGLSVRTRAVSTTQPALLWLAVTLVLGVVSVLSFAMLDLPAVGGWAAAAAVVAVLCSVLTWRGFLPSSWRRTRTALSHGRVPPAPLRVIPARPPKTERQTRGTDGDMVVTSAFDGDYPLAPSAFLVGAHIPLAFVAPHAGAASGQATTQMRIAPPVLRERIGPKAGDNHDELTYLSVADFWSGVGVVGQAGSGKTAFLEHLWGFSCHERVNPTGILGVPLRHAMVAFDTKGDGMATVQYARWSECNGDRALVIQVSDPTDQVGIELFPDTGEGTVPWARHVVSAMRYIWGEDSIGAESFDTLTRVFAAAKLVTPDIASRVTLRQLPASASPFFYANILLTNEGDELGRELAAAIADAAAYPGANPELPVIVSLLAPLYGDGKTLAQRAQLVKAPRTKVAALMAAEHWWSRPKRTTWKAILENDIAAIVNTGSSPAGHLPDEKLRTDLSGLMLYTLHEEIKRTCRGWYEQGRAISIFSDEVKHIAESSAEVIRWMRNDARANGVRPVFATQTPDTLVDEVRRTMLGFGSLVLFAQNEASTVKEIVADLTLAGGEWQTSDVTNLDRYEAIVRASAGGKRLDPFTVRVPDFRSQRDNGTWEG